MTDRYQEAGRAWSAAYKTLETWRGHTPNDDAEEAAYQRALQAYNEASAELTASSPYRT